MPKEQRIWAEALARREFLLFLAFIKWGRGLGKGFFFF
jgi:hypothetical protein